MRDQSCTYLEQQTTAYYHWPRAVYS